MAWEKEMSTPPKLHSEYYGIFTFTFTSYIAAVRYSFYQVDSALYRL